MYAPEAQVESNPFLAGLAAAQAAKQETCELWPENEKPINLFSSLSTQWRVSAGGACGLDYNVLFYCMGRMSLSAADHDQLFADIRVIEAEALQIMNKKDA